MDRFICNHITLSHNFVCYITGTVTMNMQYSVCVINLLYGKYTLSVVQGTFNNCLCYLSLFSHEADFM